MSSGKNPCRGSITPNRHPHCTCVMSKTIRDLISETFMEDGYHKRSLLKIVQRLRQLEQRFLLVLSRNFSYVMLCNVLQYYIPDCHTPRFWVGDCIRHQHVPDHHLIWQIHQRVNSPACAASGTGGYHKRHARRERFAFKAIHLETICCPSVPRLKYQTMHLHWL